MRVSFIPLLVLALPFIEIAGFVIVGREIGVLATLGFVVAAAVIGAMVLRIQGLGAIERIREEVAAGRDPSHELANGTMIAIAGILLLIPGFVTDILGLLLLLPPVRGLAWHFLQPRMTVGPHGFDGFDGSQDVRSRTIDLDADQYSRRPDNKNGQRRRP